MMKQRRQYSRDFKVKACKLVIDDGLKPTIVAEKFGIHPVMLYRWVQEYQTYGDDAFIGTGHLRSKDAELKKLEKEVERLRTENEILKKAAAYFAQHPELK